MLTKRVLFAVSILIAAAPAGLYAQSVLAAHSGTLHYFEGDIRIDGAAVQYKPGHFEEIKEQGVLSTGMGRAEVLLTPGVFLRVGERSSIRILDNRLISTRVDVLSGNVSLEADNPDLSVKDSPVTLLYKDYEIRPIKHGLIEISANPAQLKVLRGGDVVVTKGTDKISVKEGRLLLFTGTLGTEKFDTRWVDGLTVWARDRSQFLSAANIASARDIGPAFSGSNWYFNAYFGAFTFIPGRGTFWNPWGYGFFSPSTIRYYQVPPNYATGVGQNINASNGGTGDAQHSGRPAVGSNGTGTAPVQGSPGSTFNQRGNDAAAANRGNNMPVTGSPVRSGANVGAPPQQPPPQQPPPPQAAPPVAASRPAPPPPPPAPAGTNGTATASGR